MALSVIENKIFRDFVGLLCSDLAEALPARVSNKSSNL